MTYDAQQAITVALYNNAATVGGLSMGKCAEMAVGVLHSLHSMGFDLDDTRHRAMGSPHIPASPECLPACSEMHTYAPGCAQALPRPWDGHACSAMLPAPFARYCPWCRTHPTRDVSHLGTEEAIFGDEIDEEPSHGYWEAGDHG